jgi:hypothetical protein
LLERHWKLSIKVKKLFGRIKMAKSLVKPSKLVNKIIASICFLGDLVLSFGSAHLVIFLGVIYLLVKNWKSLTDQNRAVLALIIILYSPLITFATKPIYWIGFGLFSGWYIWKKI